MMKGVLLLQAMKDSVAWQVLLQGLWLIDLEPYKSQVISTVCIFFWVK